MKNAFLLFAIVFVYGVITAYSIGWKAGQTEIRRTIPNVVNIFPPGKKPQMGDILIHGTDANPCNPATNFTCIDIFYNGSWVDFGMYAAIYYETN